MCRQFSQHLQPTKEKYIGNLSQRPALATQQPIAATHSGDPFRRPTLATHPCIPPWRPILATHLWRSTPPPSARRPPYHPSVFAVREYKTYRTAHTKECSLTNTIISLENQRKKNIPKNVTLAIRRMFPKSEKKENNSNKIILFT